ncbi:MAG: PAS domain S-box protein [Nitrospiraceae bacterium]
MAQHNSAEETPRHSEQRFQKIFEHSNDAIFLVSPSTNDILDVNPTCCRMLGYSRHELLALKISDVHPNEMPELMRFAETVFSDGKGWTNELTCTTKTGQVLPAEISASAVRIEGEDCMIAMVRDTTERIAAEKQIREQAKQLAILEERGRLARDLHDSVAQALYGVTLNAQAGERMLASDDTELAAQQLHKIREAAQEALRDMRLLIYELRPADLEQLGLAEALRTRLEAVERHAGLHVDFEDNEIGRLPSELEETIYRIAQEALNNVLKHSGAKHVALTLDRQGETVTMAVRDDGRGFELDRLKDHHGFGIGGMQERAEQAGGELEIKSALDAGTEAVARIPLEEDAAS